MRLSNYILDLGRAVAYYPGLKKITGSTTATIMLCQFLYWSDKSTKNNGWTYKDYKEIEEETGLTRNEQKTAKQTLTDLGLLSIERKRLDHNSGYKINQEVLNTLWEKESGDKSTAIIKPAFVEIKNTPPEPEELPVDAEKFPQANIEPLDDLAEEMLIEAKEKGLTTVKSPYKKGDLVDAMLTAQNSDGRQKMEAMNEIRTKIAKRLCVNPDTKHWDGFIEFAYNMQKRNGENIDRFLDWAIETGFNVIYWTPEKMRTFWPQAFAENKTNQPREDFVAPLPPHKDEEPVAPMPRDIVREHKLY